MELIYKTGHSTASINKNPNGVFTTSDTRGDRVRIVKNAKRVNVPMGEDSIEMWEYEEWKGTSIEYITYTNDLLNLPSNQLNILSCNDSVEHSDVEVELKDNKWLINMYRNKTQNEDGSFSYDRLTFERPKVDDSMTVELLTNEYLKYKDAMFEFCEYPESPIKANRTSMIPLINASIEQQKLINDLKSRIETLEGGN